MSIKAIETLYKGYRFRSRLEARWAVFFDAMGFKWIYEPQGYVFDDDTCYLPDFLIEGTLYAEIKPENPSPEDWHKIELFSKEKPLLLLFGEEPMPVSYRVLEELETDKEGNTLFGRYGGAIFLHYHHGERGAWEYSFEAGETCTYNAVIEACNAAKSARFEHGESG